MIRRARQVAALHDLDAHLAGEEGVLEVGAVVDAGREQHADRVRLFPRGEMYCSVVSRSAGVTVHAAHPGAAEEIGKDPLHGHAVLQHVGDAGRAAAVVLEHQIVAVPVADEIGAADVDVDVLGHIEVLEFRPVMRRAPDDLLGNDAVLDDLLVVIDVVEEQIQRGDPLHQTVLDGLPFVGRDDPGHRVEGKNALGALSSP